MNPPTGRGIACLKDHRNIYLIGPLCTIFSIPGLQGFRRDEILGLRIVSITKNAGILAKDFQDDS